MWSLSVPTIIITTTTNKHGKSWQHKTITTAHNRRMRKLLPATLAVAIIAAPTTTALASNCHVEKGDSIWRIAKEYHLDFARLLELNKHLKDVDLIHPGQHVNTHYDAGTGNDRNASTGANGNATAPKEVTEKEQYASNVQAESVLDFVNDERAKAGLQPLTLDNTLNGIAAEKARDMAENNYFSHDSPTYGTPFDMMRTFGVDYKSAGENIAAGQKTAQEVMQSWMNSSGHRANILSPSYKRLGVGYCTPGASPASGRVSGRATARARRRSSWPCPAG